MLIESAIENALCSALEAALDGAGIEDVAYARTWGLDDGPDAAAVCVKTSVTSPVWEDAASRLCSITVAVDLEVDEAADKTCALRLGAWEAVQGVFRNWQFDFSLVQAAFALPEFTPAGYTLSSTFSPQRANGVWSCRAQMRLGGVAGV